jgi:transcriptional regulator with XRE-family HTH domain
MAQRSPTSVDIVVGKNIRMARMTAGLSQSELAKACGISFQQIQKYEKGTNRVGSSRLMPIAEALDVPPNTLLPASQKQAATPKHRAPAILQDRVGMDVVKAWNMLNAKYRVAVRDLIQAIVSR